MARKNSNAVSSKEDKKRIEELEAQLAALRSGKETEIVIGQTEYVRIMNLFPGHLNLSTQENGKGTPYRFENFGQTKRILYSELVKVLEIHSNFAEKGYFVVLDPRVVRVHGLEDAYTKILTKDKIDLILSGSSDAHEIYASANPRQQQLIVTMLTEKLRDNPDSMDLNVVDRISRLSGVNIPERAKNAREYFEMEKESDEKEEKK